MNVVLVPSRVQDDKLMPVVPVHMRTKLIYALHAGAVAGH
jgi:hypothetical protein